MIVNGRKKKNNIQKEVTKREKHKKIKFLLGAKKRRNFIFFSLLLYKKKIFPVNFDKSKRKQKTAPRP